jgi:hypothetical protein
MNTRGARPIRGMAPAIEHALRQATRWGGVWSARHIGEDLFTVTAAHVLKNQDEVVFNTDSPRIGFAAVGHMTDYGTQLSERLHDA